MNIEFVGKNMIDKKNTLIGTGLAVVLVIVLGWFIPLIGGVLAIVVAGLVVGYLVNKSLKTGAIHGALVGLFTGIIIILYLYIIALMANAPNNLIGGLLILYLPLTGAYVLLGLGGGILGGVLKSKNTGSEFSPETTE